MNWKGYIRRELVREIGRLFWVALAGMFGQVRVKVPHMPGTSTSPTATGTGTPVTTPTADGLLRCVPETMDNLVI